MQKKLFDISLNDSQAVEIILSVAKRKNRKISVSAVNFVFLIFIILIIS